MIDGIFACNVNDPTDCYMDYDRPAGDGVVGSSPFVVMATDYTNWSVVYGCRDRSSEDRSMVDEWVWIVSRQPEL